MTINRIAKRLTREGWILQVPQPKDKPYLYMPNPAQIHIQSSRTEHFLGIADLYIALGQPNIYEVEPTINDEYRPDAYTRLDSLGPIIIELQRSTISAKKMQQKCDAFVQSAIRKEHDSKVLWIVADRTYSVRVPAGFQVVQKKEDAVI